MRELESNQPPSGYEPDMQTAAPPRVDFLVGRVGIEPTTVAL